ncbi:MAG: SCO1664 family protein [Nitriliruptoraceae bacterium]
MNDQSDVTELPLAPLSWPVRVLGRFVNASNSALLVELVDGDGVLVERDKEVELATLPWQRLAVYKPQKGEVPLWDFPPGTLHQREVAAYRVSEALGFDFVPETVLRDDLPYGPGSVQRFVPHDPWWQYFTVVAHHAERFSVALMKMVLFDLIVANADRKAGHVLVRDVRVAPGGALDDPDVPLAASLALVDHGVCFHEEQKLRTVAWDFAGAHVPEALHAVVSQAYDTFDDTLGDTLLGLLSPKEIEACRNRMGDVLTLQTFPQPHDERAFPWPLV